jgi:predicted chitinase
MRANEFLTELFQSSKKWQWSFTGSHEAVAVFHVGDIPYRFLAYCEDIDGNGPWEVEFKNATQGLGRTAKFGLTGTGNSAEVMSTVVDIMRAFLEKYKGKITELVFAAKEDSRQGLYAKMAKRLLPNWKLYQDGESFVLVAPNQVDEAELDPTGWGATPQGTDVDYFGLKVKMRPSTFLKLSHPLGSSEQNSDVEKHMQSGGKIAYPFLEIKDPVEWEDGDFSQQGKVVNHEGRNRMTHWIKMKGDEPIQVNLFLRGANRRRYVTDDMIQALSNGLISQTGQIVKDPFNASTALEEMVSSAGVGHSWTGNAPYRHLVELDELEEGWKDWVAGAAIGAAALGGVSDVGAKVMPTNSTPAAHQQVLHPKKKSPSPELIKQVQQNKVTKAATPTQDPQIEKILFQTAKKNGMSGDELAQFMAQAKHESWNYGRLQEKPVGDANKYFAKKYDPAYAPKTAKILGNKHKGDGAKYYGRGFMQLTGRDNYRMASDALGIDLLNNPELAGKPDVAAKIAVWYWNTRVKPNIKNFGDTVEVTKKINNAMFGLEDRMANYIDYKKRLA